MNKNCNLMPKLGLVLAWVVLSTASAQGLPEPVEWVENAIAEPPSFSRDQLIPIDMPSYVSITVGVDPKTIVVGDDGVVRYVVVAVNGSGSVNASYEGIRCTTDEVKTYARTSSNGAWSAVKDPQWREINDNLPSKHAFAIARQGACEAHLTISAAQVIQALRQRQKIPGRSPLQ